MSGRREVPLRVLVVGPRYSGARSRGGMASVVTVMRQQRDPRVRVRTIATYVDDPRLRRLATGVFGVLHAALLLVTRRTDVVHVHLAQGGSVVRKGVVLWAARLGGVPALVHAHSFAFGTWYDGLRESAQKIVRRALPADRWLVLGDSLVGEYSSRLRLSDGQVFVLHNPVLPPDASANRDTARVTALFLGRHGPRKGSYDLVAALAALAADRPGLADRLQVVAAGDGEVAEVRAAASAAGVTDVLQVNDWVDATTRNALLAAADVFVLPSYDEGLPMALLEAMGCGLAPVVTPVGAIGEVVTDEVDALLVAPGDVAGLGAALDRLVVDAGLRERLGRAAQRRASDLGVEPWWEALVGHWQAVSRR